MLSGSGHPALLELLEHTRLLVGYPWVVSDQWAILMLQSFQACFSWTSPLKTCMRHSFLLQEMRMFRWRARRISIALVASKGENSIKPSFTLERNTLIVTYFYLTCSVKLSSPRSLLTSSLCRSVYKPQSCQTHNPVSVAMLAKDPFIVCFGETL